MSDSHHMIRHHSRAGFSVLELIIFLAALIVLAIIAGPRLVGSLQREREPVTIEIVDSVPATVAAGSVEALAIRVMNRKGDPVANRRVEFLSSAATDSLVPARPSTDTNGVAQVSWRIGADPGDRTLRVVVHGTKLETQLATEAVAAPEPPSEEPEEPQPTVPPSPPEEEPHVPV